MNTRTLLLISLLSTLGRSAVVAQDTPHRIVFQLSTPDTLDHKMLMRNINNVFKAAPESKVEVVCYGPGMDMLMLDRSVVKDKVAELTGKGVVFDACLNTIVERRIDPSNVIGSAKHVPSGVIHLVELQEQGWSYLKGGF